MSDQFSSSHHREASRTDDMEPQPVSVEAASTTSPVAMVDAVLAGIERLLREGESVVSDEAFPSWPGHDRRNGERYPFLTDVVAILPAQDPSERTGEPFRMVYGWSLNFCPEGIGFVLSEQVEATPFVLLMNHPDYQYPQCCFEAHVFRVTRLSDDEWEYGALLRPMSPVSGMIT